MCFLPVVWVNKKNAVDPLMHSVFQALPSSFVKWRVQSLLTDEETDEFSLVATDSSLSTSTSSLVEDSCWVLNTVQSLSVSRGRSVEASFAYASEPMDW